MTIIVAYMVTLHCSKVEQYLTQRYTSTPSSRISRMFN